MFVVTPEATLSRKRSHSCTYIPPLKYGNEEDVGRGIRDACAELGLDRKDIFVTTKLWPTFFRTDRVAEGFQISFDKLNIGYIDLYLAHW